MKEIKTFEQRKEELLKKGKEKGVLTYEELAESLKGLELDADSLDELYNAFMIITLKLSQKTLKMKMIVMMTVKKYQLKTLHYLKMLA